MVFMNDFLYYKGLYKVKAITKSEGYWIVEALEDFDDFVDDERVTVKVGERRIVTPTELHDKKVLPPPIPEHVYERRLEKKVKRMVEEYEGKNKEVTP
ncbi:MAG TPA: hypothetical protein VJY36_02830 [Candidatus Bathyarchaeia archaeon]|nr:hypothetical protein [Candidatus Bathyarchaeia archaeon]